MALCKKFMINNLFEFRDLIDKILVPFVEGGLEGSQLQKALDDERVEKLLGHFENSKFPASSNHFRKLRKQDRISIGGLLNTQGILVDFLTKAGVEHTVSDVFAELHDILLDAQPEYIDAPTEYLVSLLPKDSDMTKSKKKQYLKKRIKEEFISQGQPPKWLQSPEWPMEVDKPYVFIGELAFNINGTHDDGKAYLFYSSHLQVFETVIQQY